MDTRDVKISAVVQTYNAARDIEACLRALSPADEILVVDMESTDDTRDIACRCGARVEVVERGNHRLVEAYRDYSIHSAKYDWVLVVDADELIPPALFEYLRGEIASDDSPRAFLIPIKKYFMNRWLKSYYPDYVLRFFHRADAHWPYQIHSRPSHKGPEIRIDASRTELAIVHLANETVSVNIDKMNRYTESELPRRRDSFSHFKFFTDPAFRFFKRFFIKGGFRDGWPGFIQAIQESTYRFTILAKLEEERQKKLPDSDLARDRSSIAEYYSNPHESSK